MFGIGANELFIILLFGFLIFGPDKMPAMAKTIGKAIAKFRNAQAEMSNVLKNEVYNPDSDDPFANPLDALSKMEKKVSREDRGESFTERKARYDKQRAAQKAAKERAAAAGSGAAGAAVGSVAVKGKDTVAEEAEASDTTKPTDTAETTTTPTADELYGVTPRTRKPVVKKVPAPTNDAPSSSESKEQTLEEARDAADNVQEEKGE